MTFVGDACSVWLKLGVTSLLADIGVASPLLATAGACCLAVKLVIYFLFALFSISYFSLDYFFDP